MGLMPALLALVLLGADVGGAGRPVLVTSLPVGLELPVLVSKAPWLKVAGEALLLARLRFSTEPSMPGLWLRARILVLEADLPSGSSWALSKLDMDGPL